GQRVRKVWQKAPGVVEERMYLGDLEIFRRMDGAGNVILERETLNIKSIVDKSKPEPVEEISENEQDNVLGAFERFWENADIWRFLKQKNVPANENEQKDDNRLNMFRYRIGAVSTAGYIFDHQDQTYPDRLAMVETRTVGDDGSAGQMICFQYSNHLGSAALELDETAQILSYEEYYPYGMSSYQAVNSDREITGKRYRFSSKERDEESGLYYFGARYYDADIGLWTSTDPAGQFWSPYSYTGNGVNPIIGVDSDGESIHSALSLISTHRLAIFESANKYGVPAQAFGNVIFQEHLNGIGNDLWNIAGKMVRGAQGKIEGYSGGLGNMQVRHVMKLAGVDAKGALKIMNDPAKMIDLMGQHLAEIQSIIGSDNPVDLAKAWNVGAEDFNAGERGIVGSRSENFQIEIGKALTTGDVASTMKKKPE
ncbi:MAG TPA: RHS repeat-associated core domain-containing protein, partial [Mariniphaga sp.]|nr:RHS repeat-associated core domain-containing protein [Mariniphaga sp.]